MYTYTDENAHILLLRIFYINLYSSRISGMREKGMKKRNNCGRVFVLPTGRRRKKRFALDDMAEVQK